jgi:hypothetical protein
VNRHIDPVEISGNEVIHNFGHAVNPRRIARLVVQVFDRNSVFCCNHGFPKIQMPGPVWLCICDPGQIPRSFYHARTQP